MAIKPNQSLITFSGTASAALYCDEVTVEVLYINFDRLDFTNQRLRTAKTVTGATPIIEYTLGGNPIQIATVCTSDSPRPLGPDTVAQLENAKQKMVIYRYTLTARASVASGIASLLSVAVTHDHLLSLFDFTQYLEN